MLGALVKNYFDTSYASLVSFFINDKNISEEDLAALERIIEQKRNEK